MADRITYYHLLAFLVVQPFDSFHSEWILTSFVIHTAIHLSKGNFRRILNRQVFIIASIFFIGLLSVIYSPYKQRGLDDAGRQFAMLLIPVTFVCNDFDLGKYKDRLLKIFSFTCTLTMLYLYAVAFHAILYFHLPFTSLFGPTFINHNFSDPIGMHATYLSMYVALSVSAFIFYFSTTRSKRKKAFYGICIIILLGGLLQLSSRAVSIALLINIFVLPFMLLNTKRRNRFILAAFALTSIIATVVYSIDAYRMRYVSEFRKDLSSYSENIEIYEPRIVRWKASMELVWHSPIIGYGGGSEIPLLKKKFFEKKFYSSFLNEFNAHSEYISLLLKAGAIGLALYLYVIFYGFSVAWRKKDFPFCSFMVIIAITSVSEIILEFSTKGIFFYAFFYSLFLLSNKKS